jgi:TonB family protein
MFGIEYILEVSLCWFLFFGFYHFLLRKETFFDINRMFLLLALGLGLTLPLMRPVLGLLFETSPAYSFTIGELTAQTVGVETINTANNWNISSVIFSIYLLGVGLLTFRLVHNLFKIYQLKQQGTLLFKDNYSIIEISELGMPFSFGKYLFVPIQFQIDATDEQKIIKHELVHIREKHTLDIILVEILTILFWFNPLLQLFQTALKEVHEYAADKEVLRSTPVKNYGHLLLQQAFPNIELQLIHNFNQSQLKKRIKMMTKKPSTKSAFLKYMFIAPVVIAISILFSAYTFSDAVETAIKGKVEQMPYIKECKNTDAEAQEKCSNNKLMTFVYTNVKYPKAAQKAGVQGMAVVAFIVSKKGKVTNLKIVKDPGSGLGEAALVAVQALADSDTVWEPGQEKGKKVAVEMKLPVMFKLSE